MAEAAPGCVLDDNKRRDGYEDPANRWEDLFVFPRALQVCFYEQGVWGDKSIDGRIASIDRSIRDGMDSQPKVGRHVPITPTTPSMTSSIVRPAASRVSKACMCSIRWIRWTSLRVCLDQDLRCDRSVASVRSQLTRDELDTTITQARQATHRAPPQCVCDCLERVVSAKGPFVGGSAIAD